jgi:hypothetical protein
MTDHANPAYRWSDAWLLLAIAIASQEAPASLEAVIAIGDGIQHAIFTHAELDGGLARLLAGALIEGDANRLTTTARGRELVAAAEGGKRTSILDQQHTLEQLLGAPAWSAETGAEAALPADGSVVSVEQYATVVRPYVRS